MTDESPQEIRIGDMTVRIARFRGLKAALAGALVSRVMRQVPQIQEEVQDFRKEFREKNTIVITPAMARLPRFAALGLTSEDFQAAGGNIEFPDEPDPQAVMFHVFPILFDMANIELKKFLAIIAITNSDLEEADDADEVDDALAKLGKKLMREGDIDELLELVAVGYEVLQDQILRKSDRLGKLKGLPFLQTLLSTRETPEPEMEESSPIQEETPLSPSVQPSSSDSPVDSDGIDEPSSTESLGVSSGG